MHNVGYKIETGQQNLTYTIPRINPNSTIGIYGSWNYSAAGTFNGTVTIDYLDLVPEFNETNNQLRFSIEVAGPRSSGRRIQGR